MGGRHTSGRETLGSCRRLIAGWLVAWPMLGALSASAQDAVPFAVAAGDRPFIAASFQPPDEAGGQPESPPPSASSSQGVPPLSALLETPSTPFSQPVSTVTLSPSTIGRSPAAVFVVTQEMIRRSGATNVPDVLRMVPGVHVANMETGLPVVSVRGLGSSEFGFGLPTSERLLVLIDGRDIYDPIIGGVYWPAHDLVLQDIDRIEVIRGPGASIWGANAVNGVINILTKSSADTQGALVQGIGGTETKAVTVFRYGDRLSDQTTYRVYGKYRELDEGFIEGAPAHDDYNDFRGGFRLDSKVDCTDQFTLQGDLFQSRGGLPLSSGVISPQIFDVTSQFSGGNVESRWTRTLDDDSQFTFMGVYDRFDADLPFISYARNTYILDGTYKWQWGERQRWVAGAQYRIVSDMTDSVPTGSPLTAAFNPEDRTYDLASWLIQDEIQLIPEDLTLIVGTKMEVNDFVGFQIQPTARLLAVLDEKRVTWGAVSRAVRRPNRIDEDYDSSLALGTPGGSLTFQPLGNPLLDADSLIAYEIGYREQTSEWFSWDWAGFYNVYDDLRAYGLAGVTGPPPDIAVSVLPVNAASAESYGSELSATVDMTDNWTVTGAYSFIQLQMHSTPVVPFGGVVNDDAEGRTPHNIVYLRNSWSPTKCWDVDVIFRYVDSLPADNVPSYADMDLRLAWKPRPRLEIALVGQNLLDAAHAEYGNANLIGPAGGVIFAQRTEVQRGVYASLSYQY